MKKHSLIFIFIFYSINSFIVTYSQLKDNCIQTGYGLLFTTSTNTRNIDWMNPAKGREEIEKHYINRSALSFSYLKLLYMKNEVQFGVKGGFILPSQKEYQRVFIGMQLRYQFSNFFYLFNDYSLSIATWSKEGGNSTREPHDQFWVSLGTGFNILENLYGVCGYTIPFSKTSANSKEAGYYNEQTSFELQGFIHAGVEIYF